MTDVLVDSPTYTQRLQALMQQAEITSYRALSTAAGTSRGAIDRLRRGQVGQLRVEVLLRLSQALQIDPADLMAQFGGAENPPPNSQDALSVQALRQEYERLQGRLVTQQQEVRQQVQREAIARLESWLLQWPTAVYAAQQNDNLPAARLIPLTKPLTELLKDWNLVAIGEVGSEVPYDPQLHQPLEGVVQPGQPVRIRNVGYRHGETLLYRAKVSPLGT